MPGAVYTNTNLHDNLLGYWSLNYTLDNLVTGQTPTSSSNITHVAAKIKNGVSFNGTSSEIFYPSLNVKGLKQLTVACWIKPDTINKYAFFVSQWEFSQNTSFAFSKYSTGQLTVHIADSDNDNPGNNYMFSTNANLQIGVWTHVAFVFDGNLTGNTNRVKIYQNGVQLSTTMGLGNIASQLYGTSTLLFGDLNYTDDSLKFDGDVEAIGIWNRALTNAEILRLYNGGRGLELVTTRKYDTDSEIYFQSLTPQPSTAFKFALNEVITGLKSNGDWDKFDYLLLAATENSQHALIPLKNPTLFTPANNSMQWIVNKGYNAANGTYFNTDFKPGIDGANFQQNDASYGHYIVRHGTNILGANGCYDTPGSRDVNVFFRDTNGTIFSLNASGGNGTNYYELGLNCLVRTNSTTTAFYTNGQLVNTYVAPTTTGRPLIDYYVGARNADGGPANYGVDEITALVFMGSSTIDWANFNSVIQDFALRRIGLIAFYPLNGNTNDALGISNGTQTHVSYDLGKHGDQAATFNGSTSSVIVPYTSQLNSITTEMSFAAWIKPADTSDEIVIIKTYDVGGNGDYFITKTGGKWRAATYSGTGSVISSVDVTAGVWAHVAFTAVENGDLKLYVNGVLQGTDSSAGLLQSLNFNLFLGTWNSTYFAGVIQDVGIWNRILNEKEILRLYNSGVGFKVY